jgi:hypothetical protein
MLAHCTLALDVYSRDFGLPDSTHWYSPISKWFALSVIPFPRGIRLPAQLPLEDGLQVEQERESLINGIRRFADLPEDHTFTPHFMIGALSREDFGRLAYKHTDHHLRQFGG